MPNRICQPSALITALVVAGDAVHWFRPCWLISCLF
jgi:hypothetical protein